MAPTLTPFRRRTALLALALAGLSVATAAACGGDTHETTGAGGGSGGGGGGGGGSDLACPEAPKIDGCTVAVAPSDDDYDAIQTAFGEAHAGDTICLCPGTYALKREISLGVENVTVRGAGAALGDVVLDFATQDTGDAGFSVTSNGFTVENLTVKNTPGDGIDVTGAKGVTFRDLKVFWEGEPSADNGAYAVYPVRSEQILIENVEVIGAADAGIYVGQSTDAIVRNCVVHGSVAGIESENMTNMEVYGNEVYDNTAGILLFALPNLDKKDAILTNVHDNDVHDNNRDNFAEVGSIVSFVPSGIGILLLAADRAEVHDNTIKDQKTVGVTMVSFNTLKLLGVMAMDDPKTDPYPERDYIHDNTFTHCGYDPSSPLDLLPTLPVEDIVWDGEEASMGSASLCLGTTNLPTFRNINGIANLGTPANQSTDTTPFECEGNVLDPVSF